MMRIVEKPHENFPNIKDEFFNIAPFDPEAIEKTRKQVLKQSYPRDQLASILYEYKHSLENIKALPYIERLRNPDSVCVVTGQQLGLMGGPAYTILKAISCLLLARKTQSIPIFWLATEDHDLHEIDHTYLIDALGNLKEYKLKLDCLGCFVEDLQITDKHREIINSFLNAVHMTDFQDEVKGETSYVRVMAKFLKRLFKGSGIVFLEPRLLRPLAKNFFRKEISQSEEIERILLQTAEKLNQAGIKPSLAIAETNLVLKDENGKRKKVFRKDDVLDLIETQPERFNTNAIARPVLQSLLIPTLSYVAGPSELYYHQQLRHYFEFHNCAMPWISLRFSATIITPKWVEILTKCRLDPWNPIPIRWEELFPGQDPRKVVQDLGISYASLHTLNNALNPHHKLQERVLNWCLLQADFKTDLIKELMKNSSLMMNRNHFYVFL